MRRVIIGTTEDGRSTVISDGKPELALHAPPGEAPAVLQGGWTGSELRDGEAVVHQLWALDATPTPPTAGATAPSEVGFDVAVGATKWIVTEMGPNLAVPLHKTATADYAVIISGTVNVGLETGSVDLEAGDVALIGGAQHSWHAGPKGCVIATVLVGLPESYQPSNVPQIAGSAS